MSLETIIKKKTEVFINNNNWIFVNKNPIEKCLDQTINLVTTANNIFNIKSLMQYKLYIAENGQPN